MAIAVNRSLRVSIGLSKWSPMVDDPACHHTLPQVYQFLMQKEDSSYAKFVHMHINGYHRHFLHEIFTAHDFHGIECALWPSLYHTTAVGKSVLEGQTNRARGKISYTCKVLSPVLDYALCFEQL